MNSAVPLLPKRPTRIGFHYFPDTYHFTENDLAVWLPELRQLGASWLVLQSPVERAIPEYFLAGLVAAGIEPVIHFPLALANPPQPAALRPLIESYARWGVHSVCFFDRPNDRAAWPASGWAQQDLVERFLDRFLPLAGVALQNNLAPIFPPLVPGGSYWDTTFLRTALESLQRRHQTALLNALVLSAYAWSGGRPLNWGAGGPERWPEARPYFTPAGEQDHLGFRIFDWYRSIAGAVLQRDVTMLLFQAGLPGDPAAADLRPQPQAYAESCLSIAQLLSGLPTIDPQRPADHQEPVPDSVLASCFWLLSAAPESSALPLAWYTAPDSTTIQAEALKKWVNRPGMQPLPTAEVQEKGLPHSESTPAPLQTARSVKHYLLLPDTSPDGIPALLSGLSAYIQHHLPTIGFSLDEACQAAHVTAVGGAAVLPPAALALLRSAGCWVERIDEDGTEIATDFASEVNHDEPVRSEEPL